MRSWSSPWRWAALNRELLAWEQTYNTIRPHQALGYLTPTSSSPSGNRNERRPSVTDLPDEYANLTAVSVRHIVRALDFNITESSRMPKLSSAKWQSRRHQIIQAAFGLFATKGIHGTTMRDIYREAALSPGAVYNYFPTKDEIIKAVLAQQKAQTTVFLEALRDLSSMEQVTTELNRWGEYELYHPDGQRQLQLHVQFWSEVISNPALVEDARDLFGGYREALEEVVREGQRRGEINPALDARAVARAIISFYLGMEIQASYEEHFNGANYLEVVKALMTGTFGGDAGAKLP